MTSAPLPATASAALCVAEVVLGPSGEGSAAAAPTSGGWLTPGRARADAHFPKPIREWWGSTEDGDFNFQILVAGRATPEFRPGDD